MAHKKIRTWGITIALILGAAGLAWAANTKLSSLGAGAAMADADLFYDVQSAGAGGVKLTGTQVWTWIQGHLVSPGAIGGTTPAAGSFTTLSATGNLTTNVTGGGTQCLHANNTGVVTGTSSDCGAGGGGVSSVTCNSGNTITTTGTCPSSHPGYVVNNWYVPVGVGGFAVGVTTTANLIKCYYGAVLNKVTIGALGFSITTADTGRVGNVQLAIYNDDPTSHRPGTLLSSTTSSMTTSAVATVSAPLGANKQVGPGGNDGTSDVWFCANGDNNTYVARSQDPTVGGSPGQASYIGSATLSVILSASANILSISCTGGNCQGGSSTFNTWPASLATSTWTENLTKIMPIVVFQVASVP